MITQFAYVTRCSCIPAKSGFHKSQFIYSLYDIWNPLSNYKMGFMSPIQRSAGGNALAGLLWNPLHMLWKSGKKWKSKAGLEIILEFLRADAF